MNFRFPYRFRVLVFLFFLTLITYLDRVCISLVGVRIKSDFHLTNEQFGWALAAFALAYAIFEIPSGVLGDRIGQRAVLIRIVIWWSIFTALTGLTTGLISLILVRFLFGVGESGAYPNSTAVVSRWFPFNETSRSISALFVGQNTGAAIAPLIIIPVTIALGWRAPFFIIGGIGLIWVLVCFFWFRNNPSEQKKISREEKDFIESNRRIAGHNKGFAWRDAFRNTTLRAMVIAIFCSQWAQYFFIAWMPVYLQEGRKISENNMETIVTCFFATGIIGVILAGTVGDVLVKKIGIKFTRKWMGIVGFSFLGIMFLITAMASNNFIALGALYIGQIFYSIIPVTYFSVCIDLGKSRVGTVAGIINFAGQIGSFLLAIVFGKVVDLSHDFSKPLFVIAGVLFVGAICWFWVDSTREIQGAE